MNRRSLITSTSGAALAAFFVSGTKASAIGIELQDMKTISWQPEHYHGWPTVTRRQNGELWVAWSGGREGHVCPFGQLCVMSSVDRGESWNYPRVLQDSPLDDRDGGIVETAKGILIATTFTSTAYVSILKKAEQENKWPQERLNRWRAVHARLDDAQRKAFVGHWLVRSTDGGITWSERIASPVNSPHGPVSLRNGRLLYAGKELFTEKQRASVCESKDDGLTWEWIADLPVRDGDDGKAYHEFHLVEAANGTLILHVRNHNKLHENETLQSESPDNGRTWSPLCSIGVWGLPSHLLLLKDGRLLMSYGHRRAPLGNQARVSADHGKTWSAPIILSDDGTSGDLGYPSTVQLEDGSLLTVWYERLKSSPNAVLRQTRWKLK